MSHRTIAGTDDTIDVSAFGEGPREDLESQVDARKAPEASIDVRLVSEEVR